MTPTTAGKAVLAALLTLFSARSPAVTRIRADERRILDDATAAVERFHVPFSILFVVGFVETWCGEYPGEGHGWGAPCDFRHRHVPGTAADAARVLAAGYVNCGSWQRAAAWFRSGVCRGSAHGDRYGALIVRLVDRTHAVTHTPVPDHLR